MQVCAFDNHLKFPILIPNESTVLKNRVCHASHMLTIAITFSVRIEKMQIFAFKLQAQMKAPGLLKVQ